MRYAAVLPLVRTRALPRPFDYAVPERLSGTVGIGSMVAVPLSGRTVLGVVVGMAATTAHKGRVRPLSAHVDLPPVPEDLVRLAVRINEHYLCAPAAALALVTPPLAAVRLGPATRAAGSGHQGAACDVHVVGAGRPERALVRGPGTPLRMGRRQRQALDLLEARGTVGEAELRRATGIGSAALRSLLAAEAVCLAAAQDAAATRDDAVRPEIPPALLAEQETALKMVREAAIDGDEVVLHGVTGSGKTEVYLRAAADVLAAGRSVIMLVPEIALTGQTVARLRARFPGEVLSVLHSGLPVGERLRAYVAAAEGRSRLIVGARSAVFAPVRDLGLIVVDEEHDDSYKQTSDPRYDARTVARWRAEVAGAGLVAGSATPSVITWSRVARRARLSRRIDGSRPPHLEVIDLRGTADVLSPQLRAALATCVEKGEKAILFLNRRGMASSVSCAHCGHTWVCPACDVAYGLFRRGAELRCRICGRHRPAPHVCPECHGLDVGRHGVGTERLEAEVAALVPGIETLRLDSDAAGSYTRLTEILRRFGEPGPRILVGTQMVAKGHHFPDVTLVGVVNADLALYFPDYRAEERTFAMLLQVAGRAGRGGRPGRVIVQTYNPHARPIVAAVEGDVDRFYADELARRRSLSYPPATVLVVLIVSAAAPRPARETGAQVAARLREVLAERAGVLGPGPLTRERDRYTCRVMVKTTDAGNSIDEIRALMAAEDDGWRRNGARVIADVEPSRV